MKECPWMGEELKKKKRNKAKNHPKETTKHPESFICSDEV